ncbi:hypothetical protein F8B43_4176 [Methylorubrum populi]|uniref:Uncharacterized protein n=1 Tax=Methylorubrum populi TaxID=223967 RepID=A0A833J3B2_9HYPH|nr:hypothetical protein F8B43_4176 [Methylorubrum populi]
MANFKRQSNFVAEQIKWQLRGEAMRQCFYGLATKPSCKAMMVEDAQRLGSP